jgi:hypothetical protein
MLVDFQQALADLTASPELCVQARRDAGVLRQRYELTERELQRLAAIVGHAGMACACIVYRANRLAPLALNLPLTCRALGAELREVASLYWTAFPEGNVHFYVESDRFCAFLRALIDAGRPLPAGVDTTLAHEAAIIAGALRESHTEAL